MEDAAGAGLGWDGVDWIHVVQDELLRICRRIARLHQRQVTVVFSRRPLVHEVKVGMYCSVDVSGCDVF